MTTAEAIEGFTDAGQFEILAIRVLRLVNHDCRRFEHLGVNAEGKTITGALDAFVLVPGSSPPRFAMAAFTTARREDLAQKWLFDHTTSQSKATSADDGDLIKAARKAITIRADHPDAEFVLHLCTNRRLDADLMNAVYAKATALGIRVEFLAQSQIRDTLDTTPDGQWLRKEHLGIPAERVSPALLRELSAQSIDHYAQEFLIGQADRFIRTISSDRLSASLGTPARTLHVLVGGSGLGKSVVAYQALFDHVRAGRIGFWLPGEVAAQSSSLEEALGRIIRALYPSIEPEAGTVTIRSAGARDELLLVIDDVNRSANPADVLRRVAAWAQPPKPNDNSTAESPTLAIIVPAWDIFWGRLHSVLKDQPWVEVIPASLMSAEEAARSIRAGLGNEQRLAEADCARVSKALGNDPILIGLFVDIFRQNPTQSADALASNVLGRFVQSVLEEAALAGGTLLSNEYGDALVALADAMLRHREFYPRWDDLILWLSPAQLDAIRILVKQGAICRTSHRGGEERFEFRHDRILEYFLVRALVPRLGHPQDSADILSDPFYIGFVGRSFAQAGVPQSALEWLQQNNPLALLAAIRFLPAGSISSRELAAAAKDWLAGAARNRTTFPAVLYDGYRILEQIDSPLVLEITEPLRTHRLLALARLANGDATAGAIFFNQIGEFYPSINAAFVDRILERAFHRHNESLVNDVAAILRNPNSTVEERIGALTLAGYIGDPRLSDAISVAWKAEVEKGDIVVPALWAGMRCGSQNPAAILDPVVAFWAALPDEEKNGRSERSRVSDEFRFAMRREMPDSAIRYLADVGRSNDALSSGIGYVLVQSNHPSALRFVVMQAAEIAKRAEEGGWFTPWISMLGDEWDPIGHRGRRLPDPARETIAEFWRDNASSPSLRSTAMRLWVRTTDDLEVLRSVPEDDPDFEIPLWRRALLGDLQVVPHVKRRLTTNSRWFEVVGPIWCDEFVEPTAAALSRLASVDLPERNDSNEAYALAHLLRDIPRAEAEELLTRYWGGLSRSARFIQVALYLGTPASRTRAASAIEAMPPTIDPFQFIDMFFGFKTLRLVDRLTMAQLESLLPYVPRLGDQTLSAIASYCSEHDCRDWAEVNVRPELDRRRTEATSAGRDLNDDYLIRVAKHEFPTDADLVSEMDHAEQTSQNAMPFWWTEAFAERGDPPDRWRRLVDEWLSSNPSINRLRIAADVVSEIGRRSDLGLLTKHDTIEPEDEVARIVANVSFVVKRRSLS